MSAILAQAARDLDDHVDTMDVLADASNEAQYRSLQREARAMYRAAMVQCRKLEGEEQSACAKAAKADFQIELAEAKKSMRADQ
ncbi:MAG TPA: hypothetical protein VEC35_19700 [Noviherbaspirillum sp.]|nr:hypothetical protein [Noviherbaspirillum sp.]